MRGVSNEMIIYSENEWIKMALKLIFETMFKYGIVPPNSNTAIIKPLIKDQTNWMSSIKINLIRLAFLEVQTESLKKITNPYLIKPYNLKN